VKLPSERADLLIPFLRRIKGYDWARKYLYFLVDKRILGEAVSPSPYLAEMGLSVTD